MRFESQINTLSTNTRTSPELSLQHASSAMLEDSNSSLHSTFAVHTTAFTSPNHNRKVSSVGEHDDGPHQEQHIPHRRQKSAVRVSFNDNVHVRETIHLNDFSDEEYAMYWITSEEQDVILNMANIIVELLGMGVAEDGEHICYRGLEDKTEQASQAYSEMYLSLVEAILQEQDQSRSATPDGVLDHDRIAALYQEWTFACKNVAWQRAQLDEYQARIDHPQKDALAS
ncbi:hypothetical protein IV203_030819 [Nitzschia inconspicua]|uniref:Uncharacterized protein n=1 Tax=Nitzschia inconspicua TaxID=303405 RepID=A0A9K3LW09_9STRA|nr:hypothetical protein IV203_030819 [Nitzschia inconspicua]